MSRRRWKKKQVKFEDALETLLKYQDVLLQNIRDIRAPFPFESGESVLTPERRAKLVALGDTLPDEPVRCRECHDTHWISRTTDTGLMYSRRCPTCLAERQAEVAREEQADARDEIPF